jgi:radical SAM superfamily enzyme YgiQ (UPF0313 family)
VDLVTKDILKWMKKAGCIQIDFGVESGSQKILNILKKDITPEQSKLAFSLCHKIGIRAFANIMINNPNETWKDLKETIRLLNELKPDRCEVWITTPYPGTELFQLFGNPKISMSSYDKLKFGKELVFNPQFISKGLKDVDLIKLRECLEKKFNKWKYLKYTSNFLSSQFLKLLFHSRKKGAYFKMILRRF